MKAVELKHKKLFLLDMDGTLYLGNQLFPGTKSLLKRIRAQGGRYLFLSNNSSQNTEAYVKKCRRLGIAAEREDFLTSLDASIVFLKKQGYQKKKIYAFGTESFREELLRAGFSVTTELEDDISLLLSGFDTELTFQKLSNSARLLTKGVEWIATNPDWVCPTEWGFVPDCGSVSEMLTRATGRKPKFIGKPEPELALLAMEKFGAQKSETILVGDRIYTDIACGVNAGIDTAFVLSGEGRMEDIERFRILPDAVFRDVGEMAERMMP